ncbi:MAG TPA: site-specific integrase [Segetibacter sp.]
MIKTIMAKARRRGSIYKRGVNSWQVKLFIGVEPDGRRNIHSATIRGTKKDAEQYLNKLVQEIDQGTYIDTPVITVDEFFNKWLESVSRLRTTERTSDGHESIYKRYFRKAIGGKKLNKLNVLDIQKVYTEMQGKGLSPVTIRHAHSVINCALKQAVKWNLLSRNPAELVELPRLERKERRVLSPEEARRFIEASEEIKHGLVFEFALLTGMRPEEYLSVQWKDLDFDSCTVQVRRALVRHNNKWSFQETKTSKSRRTVVLPVSLIQKLKAHKTKQLEHRLKVGSFWQNYDLVFCHEFGTPHSIPNLTYRYFRPILEKAGIPQIRLYDLRHSHATLLLMAEENPKVVAERLGHSTVVLTLDTYSHVLPTMQRKATDKLEKILFG